jgi:protein-L-isoaspartate(D-aspartate) O-methyltransferase
MQAAQNNMITQQLRTGNVVNEHLLNLYASLPREAFVPEAFKSFAYSDMQIPLAHDQYMMTPLEEALILNALQLNGTETVLEVGTGSGFLTALLSRLSRHVFSIDYFEAFTNQARQRLSAYNCTNVDCITGDALQGWFDKAPYDVIVFSGAITSLTDLQKLQLMPGGRLIALIGQQPVIQGQLHTLDHQGQWSEKMVFETSIPPLIDKLSQKQFVF